MDFKDQLNYYINLLNCSAQYLSSKSGISSATISRYRNGERIPEAGSDALSKLSHSIASIAQEMGILDITADSVFDTLSFYVKDGATDAEILRSNFNKLISLLSISNSDISKSMNYDSSYISRIKTGQRKPSNPEEFVNKVADYIAKKYNSDQHKSIMANLMGCQTEDIIVESNYFQMICHWLNTNTSDKDYSLTEFLHKLDEFDLSDYIRSIHFDEMKVPTTPFHFSTSKSYYGISEMMNGELDWIKATVLSKSKDDVILYSDMPLEKMAKDLEFTKKWMFGMAMMLKKGLHLNQIHYINRPFNEMMLGLEGWIPMYMTGQISPYYIKGTQNTVFQHFIRSSGAAALAGEAISGNMDHGRYLLTNNKNEVEYYRKRANDLIGKASPLMTIFRQDSEKEYKAFMQSGMKSNLSIRSIHSSLPLYTISDELLSQMLKRNSISKDDTAIIFSYLNEQRNRIKDIMKENSIVDEIPIISEEEFKSFPMSLSLSDLFYEKDILYSYDEYVRHLELTQKFNSEHSNYNTALASAPAFRNIRIIIQPGEWVLISKSKSPAIHFVIQHPKMREALEQYIPPIVD